MPSKQVITIVAALFVAGVTANVAFMFRVESRLASLETKVNLIFDGKLKTSHLVSNLNP